MSTARYIVKIIKNICPHKHLYANVRGSTIQNSPKVQTAQVSIDGRRDKGNMHSYNGTLLGHKKEQNTDTRCNVDEPCKRYAA